MDEFTACECAYKQGYEKGLKDAVKHGRWIAFPTLIEDPDGDWVALEYHCSLCNRREYKKERFCPNCGAKMDLEVTDETG